MKKETLIEKLEQQLPGFYSTEQVIKMIKDLDQEESTQENFLEDLITDIVNEISKSGLHLIYNYELTMVSGNCVELDDIDFDDEEIGIILKKHLLSNQ